MANKPWHGVLTATATPFRADLSRSDVIATVKREVITPISLGVLAKDK